MSKLWIRKTTRRFFDNDRAVHKTVWKAQVKIGTQPGDIGLFLSQPEVGSPCEVVTDGRDYAVRKPIRVTVDRFDDVSQRVWCSLR